MKNKVSFMETAVPSPFIVRKGNSLDLPKIREYLALSTTRISLPRPTKCEIELFVTPPDMPLSLLEERLFVVEENERIIGHFFLWRIDDRLKCVQVIAAFEGSCEEKEVAEAARHLFKILFEQKKMHRIIFLVHPEEFFFFRVVHSLGLFFEGILRKHIALDGNWYDICSFSILATDALMKEKAKISKENQYDWLVERARYDEIEVFVVRAVLLKIVQSEIKVLLLKRADNLSLPGVEETPGGVVKEGESIQQALSREVKEKVGIEISENISFLTSFDFTCTDGKRVREFVFRVQPTSWDVSIQREEYESFCWLPLQEVPLTKLHPDLIQILSSYSPIIAYEGTGCPAHEENASLELIRPPSVDLEKALLTGIHLDAYAARGFGIEESIGLSLRDGMNRVVGGIVFEFRYNCLHLRRLWVDPEWRRLGWGKKLMLRAESLAKERGCSFAIGVVMEWEDVSFFQKLGYAIEGTIQGFEGDARGLRIRKEF